MKKRLLFFSEVFEQVLLSFMLLQKSKKSLSTRFYEKSPYTNNPPIQNPLKGGGGGGNLLGFIYRA
jgi:hypothetical protein